MNLIVSYLNGSTRYFTIPEMGWKIDPNTRCIVIGRGLPRTMIPLDTVAYFEIELPPKTSDQTMMLEAIRR